MLLQYVKYVPAGASSTQIIGICLKRKCNSSFQQEAEISSTGSMYTLL